MKRCLKCGGLFVAKHPRHKFCADHQKIGMRGMRHYHAIKGEYVNAGIGASRLRQFSQHFSQEVRDEAE